MIPQNRVITGLLSALALVALAIALYAVWLVTP